MYTIISLSENAVNKSIIFLNAIKCQVFSENTPIFLFLQVAISDGF